MYFCSQTKNEKLCQKTVNLVQEKSKFRGKYFERLLNETFKSELKNIQIYKYTNYEDVFMTRKILNDGAKYFGPYPSVSAAREMINFQK